MNYGKTIRITSLMNQQIWFYVDLVYMMFIIQRVYGFQVESMDLEILEINHTVARDKMWFQCDF